MLLDSGIDPRPIACQAGIPSLRNLGLLHPMLGDTEHHSVPVPSQVWKAVRPGSV